MLSANATGNWCAVLLFSIVGRLGFGAKKRKRTGGGPIRWFEFVLVLQPLNFYVGNCPIFPEKISFADVIGCPRWEGADAVQLRCAVVIVFIYKVQMVFPKQLHVEQFSIVRREDELRTLGVCLLALEFGWYCQYKLTDKTQRVTASCSHCLSSKESIALLHGW